MPAIKRGGNYGETMGPRHGRSPAREEGNRYLILRLLAAIFNRLFGAFDQNVGGMIPVVGFQSRVFELGPHRSLRDVVLSIQGSLIDGAHGFPQIGIAEATNPLNMDFIA